MTIEHFQNLIIGSGAAGKILAWTLASQGQKTVVVERSMVGGSCPNVACLPSKIWTHPTAAEGLLGLFANPPAAPESSISSRNVNRGRQASTAPATAKD